jgi:hypothetical protein
VPPVLSHEILRRSGPGQAAAADDPAAAAAAAARGAEALDDSTALQLAQQASISTLQQEVAQRQQRQRQQAAGAAESSVVVNERYVALANLPLRSGPTDGGRARGGARQVCRGLSDPAGRRRSHVLTEFDYLCNVCSCHERLRRPIAVTGGDAAARRAHPRPEPGALGAGGRAVRASLGAVCATQGSRWRGARWRRRRRRRHWHWHRRWRRYCSGAGALRAR